MEGRFSGVKDILPISGALKVVVSFFSPGTVSVILGTD